MAVKYASEALWKGTGCAHENHGMLGRGEEREIAWSRWLYCGSIAFLFACQKLSRRLSNCLAVMPSWPLKAAALAGFEEIFFRISLRTGRHEGNCKRISTRFSNGGFGFWEKGIVHHFAEARTEGSSAVNEIMNLKLVSDFRQ